MLPRCAATACRNSDCASLLLTLCGKCKTVSYCSTKCQKVHEREHKKTCGKVVPSISEAVATLLSSDEVDVMESCLKSGTAQLNSNLIIFACNTNCLQILKYLVENKNVTIDQGMIGCIEDWTLLMVICSYGYLDMAVYLISLGADIKMRHPRMMVTAYDIIGELNMT